jgi:hypothetical protein
MRYGHLNFPALHNLARGDMVRRLPKLEQVDQVYGGCLAGKNGVHHFHDKQGTKQQKSWS